MGYLEQSNLRENKPVGAFFKRPMPRIYNTKAVACYTKNHLLAAAPDEVFIRLMPFLESVALSKCDYVYQPGDRVEYVYFPESAVMSEYQILDDGRTLEIAMTGSEGAIGLLAAINSHPATNWTQPSAGGRALRIKSGILRENGFQKLFFNYLENYVGHISQRAVCNSLHSVEERFCSWLLMLQNRLKTAGIPLTHEQIARFLGVHRPSITHIAQTLREKNAVAYTRGKIHISRRDILENLSCGCYAEIDKNFAFM